MSREMYCLPPAGVNLPARYKKTIISRRDDSHHRPAQHRYVPVRGDRSHDRSSNDDVVIAANGMMIPAARVIHEVTALSDCAMLLTIFKP